MSFISVAAGQPIRATHVQQFTSWLTAQKLDTPGTIACTSSSEFALTVRSQEGTTGMALAVQYGSSGAPTTLAYFTKDETKISSNDGSDYLRITNTGVGVVGTFTVNGSTVVDISTLVTLTTTGPALASLQTALTDGLPVQDGDSYSRMAISEGAATPTAATLAPMLNFQRRAAHNAVDTTQSSDYYYQSARFGSVAQALTTASSGTATGIALTGAGWGVNTFAGMQIDIVAGTGSGQRAIVASNTATAVAISGSFSTTPDETSQFIINSGGAPDLYALACYAYDQSTAKPMNNLHSTIAISGFSKQSSTAAGTGYGALFLSEMGSTTGTAIGVEIDVVNNSNSAALEYSTAARQSIGLNIASFASPSGYSGTNNSLGLLIQSDGSAGALLTGMLFGAASVKNYAIDFNPLAGGGTTPKVIRLGSGHQIVGRKAATSVDVAFLAWEIDDTLRLRGTNGVLFENEVGTESARINSGGLLIATGGKIYGDCSNATIANRLTFETLTANGSTLLQARPGSGGAASGFNFYNTYGQTDARMQIAISNVQATLASESTGGTALPLRINSGGSQRLSFETNGDIVPGSAALATDATSGFLYVASCAGAPTGTPTTYTGRVPHVVDTTNLRAYYYIGGTWRYAALT